MAVYFEDEMKPGFMHDHMDGASVKFWHTNDEGYRTRSEITMYIEYDETWDKITKVLKKRYIKPDIVSVKCW